MFNEDPRAFAPISQQGCREHLAAHTFGRLAWQAADGPLVLPISYACYGEELVFRTSPYGVLSELVRPTDVALQLDELDEHRRTGWTVLVQGRAEAVAESAEIVRLWAVDGMVPWAPGVRNLFIQITPRRITGRLLTRTRHPEGQAPAR